jgi:S1-C subfamily serine protease
MRNVISCMCVVLVLLAMPVFGGDAVGPTLQKMSVNVAAGSSQGSGTIVVVDMVDKTKTTFILTAEHVVRGLRSVRDVIGSDGDTRKQVQYRDAQVIQEQVADGRTVGEVKYDAAVINVDTRRDIALLRVRANFVDDGIKFYLDEALLPTGTELFHAGAPGGKEIGGTASLTSGIISRIGVRIPEYGGAEHGIFDQTSCASLPGSSGGLVALKEDGRWVGMITLGLQGGTTGFNWVVPVRSVKLWVKEIKAEWLLDPKAERPTEEKIKEIPLELNPPGFASTNSTPTPAPVDDNKDKNNAITQLPKSNEN